MQQEQQYEGKGEQLVVQAEDNDTFHEALHKFECGWPKGACGVDRKACGEGRDRRWCRAGLTAVCNSRAYFFIRR